MIKSGWLVRYVPLELPTPRGVLPFPVDFRDDWARWLDRADIPVGTPFLISPEFEYDVALNAFFGCPLMIRLGPYTQTGYAHDLSKFLTFLWTARGGRSWRDATEADHTAYLY